MILVLNRSNRGRQRPFDGQRSNMRHAWYRRHLGFPRAVNPDIVFYDALSGSSREYARLLCAWRQGRAIPTENHRFRAKSECFFVRKQSMPKPSDDILPAQRGLTRGTRCARFSRSGPRSQTTGSLKCRSTGLEPFVPESTHAMMLCLPGKDITVCNHCGRGLLRQVSVYCATETVRNLHRHRPPL